MTRTRPVLLALGLTCAAALAAATATARTDVADVVRKPQTRTVKVIDNYYQPRRLTVNRSSTVRFVWTDEAADVHDVKLTSGPRGVRKFETEPLAVGDVYKRVLKVPGTYKILCTFHEEDDMRMTIIVRKRR